MSFSPVNGKELLRLSVQQNPEGWRKAVKDYYAIAQKRLETLGIWREGASHLTYRLGNKQVILMGSLYSLEQEQEIIQEHRALLLRNMAAQLFSGKIQQEVEAVSNYLISKISKPGKAPNNLEFVTERLGKLFDKIEAGKIETEQEKEETKRHKLNQEKIELEAQIKELESPEILHEGNKLDLNQVRQDFLKLPVNSERSKLRIGKIVALIDKMKVEKVSPKLLDTLGIDKETLDGLPAEADHFPFVLVMKDLKNRYEKNEKKLEDTKKCLKQVNEKLLRLTAVSLPQQAIADAPTVAQVQEVLAPIHASSSQVPVQPGSKPTHSAPVQTLSPAAALTKSLTKEPSHTPAPRVKPEERNFFALCKQVLNWFKSIFMKFWSFLKSW